MTELTKILIGALVLSLLALIYVVFTPNKAEASFAQVLEVRECMDVFEPKNKEFSENVAKRGTVMADYKWFEEKKGFWVLKIDLDPRGGHEKWASEYTKHWHIVFNKPVRLPQSITENTCERVCTDELAKDFEDDFDSKTQISDNKLCEYSTHRWCEETTDGYTAIAVPNNEKNPEGKPWETGMDKNCEFPVEEEEVVVDPVVKSSGGGEACDHKPSNSPRGFRFLGATVLKWNKKASADKIDITAYDTDRTTMLWQLRTKDDGIFELNGLPGTYFKIRGMNNCGLGDWTKKISM